MAKKSKTSVRKGGSRSRKERGLSLKPQQAQEGRERRGLKGPPKLGVLIRVATTGITRGLKQAAKGLWTKAKPFITKNKLVIRSLAIFVGIILAFILTLPVYRGFLYGPLLVAIARVTGFILRVFGMEAHASGTTIVAPVFSVKVIAACSGIFAYVLFVAAVLAYPCKLKEKTIGIGLGVPTIFAVNLVRMVSLFYIGAYLPQFFEAAHLLFWQALMIAIAVLIWLFWAQRLTHVRQ